VAFIAGWLRAFIADYGIPLMIVIWTGLSYTVPSKVPSAVPRRLVCPLPWEPASLYHWTVIKVLLPILCIFFLSSCETEQVLSFKAKNSFSPYVLKTVSVPILILHVTRGTKSITLKKTTRIRIVILKMQGQKLNLTFF